MEVLFLDNVSPAWPVHLLIVCNYNTDQDPLNICNCKSLQPNHQFEVLSIMEKNWSEWSGCAANGCYHKRRWPLQRSFFSLFLLLLFLPGPFIFYKKRDNFETPRGPKIGQTNTWVKNDPNRCLVFERFFFVLVGGGRHHIFCIFLLVGYYVIFRCSYYVMIIEPDPLNPFLV